MSAKIDALTDTIVACATPPGEGAIAIVRLSGPEARRIAARLAPERAVKTSHQLVRGRIVDTSGTLLDDAMVVEMHAPRSYTGEDVVELHLHGSRVLVEAVLAASLELGARLARPGEFTLRAFLRGRMDLAQAEAVADLIVSRNETQRRVAAGQLDGGLSRAVGELEERLERRLAECRAALDFPEYQTGSGLAEAGVADLDAIMCRLQEFIERSRSDLHRGLKIVLCGAPNVGKSTLLNAWAGRERVLVDEEPGTTRDPVEVDLTSGTTQWSVCDTAGVHRDATGVEARGIEMSREWIQRADHAVWLVSPDDPVWPEPGLAVRVLGSKGDKAGPDKRLEIEAQARAAGCEIDGWVSARDGEGVVELKERLLGRVDLPEDGVVVVHRRHVAALERARAALGRLRAAQREGATLDVLAVELEEATLALGEILGRNVDVAVLDRIFSQFCIGK